MERVGDELYLRYEFGWGRANCRLYSPRMGPKRRVRWRYARWVGAVLGVAIALLAGIARADGIVRKPSESDDDFVARVLGPSSELAQEVVRSTEIARGKVTLIGFVNAKDNTLVGHLLLETSPGRYEHVTFPSCDEEGGAPDLLAVFFARTAKDGGRDSGRAVPLEHPARGRPGG